MAIDHRLFSGQCSSIGEDKIEHSLSATAKVMPLHPGNRRPSVHRAPKKAANKT
ncbi:hypothetical protein [Fibrobacter sp. UWR2]|uniref:hypothetical protein n=1 Tax=Fibrobacter sp. UWR2 TaxID=1964352 RepID=UPI00157024BB|nr:hypothetical protein [Fibrobacter sp. UWR2]